MVVWAGLCRRGRIHPSMVGMPKQCGWGAPIKVENTVEGRISSVHEYAVTVIGTDRPGIVAEATAILARLGLNLTDSTMTRLRGNFAMTLICAGDGDPMEIEAALEPLTRDGSLVVNVRPVAVGAVACAVGPSYVLTVHGADRLGIVAALTKVVAEAGGNITNLTTRLAGDLYVVAADVDLPPDLDVTVLDTRLRQTATALGVGASLRPDEADVL